MLDTVLEVYGLDWVIPNQLLVLAGERDNSIRLVNLVDHQVTAICQNKGR